MKIEISKEIRTVCPQFVGAGVVADVSNTEYSEGLWKEMSEVEDTFRETLTTETIKSIEAIAATRKIYKVCGKDPSRYRPAAEALIRRVLNGKTLYQIDTVVDLVNLASMKYGYSIGAFDKDKIIGERLVLGIGREGEPYEGIGRGMVNISGLPVYRDDKGGIGTPTTDNERTKVELGTRHLLVLINGYDGSKTGVTNTAEYILRLLKLYCKTENGRYFIY